MTATLARLVDMAESRTEAEREEWGRKLCCAVKAAREEESQRERERERESEREEDGRVLSGVSGDSKNELFAR